jgi:hypothetical protein
VRRKGNETSERKYWWIGQVPVRRRRRRRGDVDSGGVFVYVAA